MRTERTESPNLAAEVVALQSQLATAEAANVNPRVVAIDEIRAQLDRNTLPYLV
jgi:hypothetical protein